jgi:hypothetical protein
MDVLVWPETDALVAPGMTAPPAVPSFLAGTSLLAACLLAACLLAACLLAACLFATPLFAAGESALSLLVAVAPAPLVLAVPPPLVLAAPATPVPEPAVAAAGGTSPLFTKPTAPSPESGAGYS